jgi:foldase protein PrsA
LYEALDAAALRGARSLESARVSINLRSLQALGAFFMVTIALAACGDSVPGNSVASIDGDTITRTKFAHWFNIATATSQPQGAKVQYSPPDYTACVASKRKTAPKPAKGQPQQTSAQLQTQCKQEYEGLRDQVLQFLILDKWVSSEAQDQGIRLSTAELDKAVDEARKQSELQKDAAFQAYLKQAGMTLADARFQIRFSAVYTKLREKAVKNATKVTDKSVAAFYEKNKQRFATPATRDLRVILTKTEARAGEAKKALESGQGWKAVAKKYSIDQASKNQGGSLLGIAKGTQEKSFDDAIFAAKKGALTGPVKTQFGYYVFQVQKIVEAKQQSLKEATPAIKQQLDAQNKQKADDEFNISLRKKWKARTNCADEYVMTQCKNAPKPKTSTTAPAGGVQQAPQPQQPPAG